MSKQEQPQENKSGKEKFPGYPHYPKSQDIYNKAREEGDLDPENPATTKVNENTGSKNEKDFVEDVSGSDLDVPGSEMDDAQEAIGSEDEENNYYSLGGDDKESLEEDTGDRR